MDRIRHRRLVLLCLVFLLVLVCGGQAHAWGTEGHQVIATLAERQLTPAARAGVHRLLALEPGATLVSISTWADEHRSPQTAAWHYVNLPRGDCMYEAERDCPDGRCVVAAIERQSKVLASKAPDELRFAALKYLVHLVADVHQPLHAGYQDDRGGNTYQLQAFGRGTNLHTVWDSGLIKHLDEDVDTLAARLGQGRSHRPWTAAQAAQESCSIVASAGFYPGRHLDAVYLERFTQVMETRLALAGARLAELLNRPMQ